jgi:hypothetical protein
MSTKKEEIVGTMTIKEAAANWKDPRRQHLKRWGETFGVPLQELHPGHVVTYQNDRGDETTAAQVDAEVSALLALLKQIGLGGEITAAEFKALPETTRKYIEKLRQEIYNLQAGNDRMANRIRRTNWGRSR